MRLQWPTSHSETLLIRKERDMLREGGERRNSPTQRKGNEIQAQIEITMLPGHLCTFRGFFFSCTRGSVVPSQALG